MILVLTLLMGCGPERYGSVDQCESMSAGASQDTCWADTLPNLFRTDRAKAERLTKDKVQDSRVRDFIWLTVTRDVDPGSMRYCEFIEEPAMKERCRVLVSRPHLHRELTGKGGQGPGAGGTPAGGKPPEGGKQGP